MLIKKMSYSGLNFYGFKSKILPKLNYSNICLVWDIVRDGGGCTKNKQKYPNFNLGILKTKGGFLRKLWIVGGSRNKLLSHELFMSCSWHIAIAAPPPLLVPVWGLLMYFIPFISNILSIFVWCFRFSFLCQTSVRKIKSLSLSITSCEKFKYFGKKLLML